MSSLQEYSYKLIVSSRTLLRRSGRQLPSQVHFENVKLRRKFQLISELASYQVICYCSCHIYPHNQYPAISCQTNLLDSIWQEASIANKLTLELSWAAGSFCFLMISTQGSFIPHFPGSYKHLNAYKLLKKYLSNFFLSIMLLKQNLWTLKAVWIVPQPQQGTWLHTNCFEIKSADNEILS